MHTYELTIKEFHLDTFGHMNNATYLAVYEEARWDLIEGNDYGLKRIQELKIGPVILEAKIVFKREIVNREVIRIETTPKPLNHPLIMELHQQMVKSDGQVASTLELKVGLMDMKQRKLIQPTAEWLKAINC